jgi:hypothetical protein
MGTRAFFAVLAGACVVMASASNAFAEVHREGTWPADDKELVSLSVDGLPRAEAVRRLADKAGWSIVVETSGTGTVDVRVKQQPAAKVLELILGEGDYVARRDGSLVSILPRLTAPTPAPAAVPAPQPSAADAPPPAPAAPSSAEAKPSAPLPRGKDRVVIGESTVIKRDEVVKDLAVFGGSAQVYGRVSGDATVFGGSLVVHPGGRVEGDLSTFGGSVDLKDGSHVSGDVTTFGGSVRRGPKASVGVEKGSEDRADDDENDDDHDDDAADAREAKSDLREAARDLREGRHGRHEFDTDDEHDAPHESKPSWRSVAQRVGGAVTRTALLFAFGVILWALTGRRVEALQGEVVARPVRAFALGAVAVIAAVAVVVALCVTIVGIPLGLFVLCAAIFGAYAGVCAALTAAGAALLHHKTTSPYIHLAAGCVIYLVLSSIPYVGGFVTALAFLIGFGALMATRAAGLAERDAKVAAPH